MPFSRRLSLLKHFVQWRLRTLCQRIAGGEVVGVW
jgi:hypothetical protein